MHTGIGFGNYFNAFFLEQDYRVGTAVVTT